MYRVLEAYTVEKTSGEYGYVSKDFTRATIVNEPSAYGVKVFWKF